jgi:hypothetical protein
MAKPYLQRYTDSTTRDPVPGRAGRVTWGHHLRSPSGGLYCFPHQTSAPPKIWVPHPHDGFIVVRVGIARVARPLPPTLEQPHPSAKATMLHPTTNLVANRSVRRATARVPHPYRVFCGMGGNDDWPRTNTSQRSGENEDAKNHSVAQSATAPAHLKPTSALTLITATWSFNAR